MGVCVRTGRIIRREAGIRSRCRRRSSSGICRCVLVTFFRTRAAVLVLTALLRQATYTFPVGVTTLWWYAPAESLNGTARADDASAPPFEEGKIFGTHGDGAEEQVQAEEAFFAAGQGNGAQVPLGVFAGGRD